MGDKVQCKVCLLEPELRRMVEEALSRGLGVRHVSALLEQRGVQVSRSAIHRHRVRHMEGGGYPGARAVSGPSPVLPGEESMPEWLANGEDVREHWEEALLLVARVGLREILTGRSRVAPTVTARVLALLGQRDAGKDGALEGLLRAMAEANKGD